MIDKILVPLPEPEARRAMFDELLPSKFSKESLPYDLLVGRTEGYSGSDIQLLGKEAAMQPLRRLTVVLEGTREKVPEDGMTSKTVLFEICMIYLIHGNEHTKCLTRFRVRIVRILLRFSGPSKAAHPFRPGTLTIHKGYCILDVYPGLLFVRELLSLEPIKAEDIETALKDTRPSTPFHAD
ncbi:hypothetical protein Dsin_019112 [Dipteronia sinensis]|uniref:AAA ATPase AAA+ lid domain-containing protein n=1 Tax=Dipteronia sinensis TaxID=43782 RepID=A0AAE0A835_9ROSI|nr:hypothetical protein Dsin_019112 [Dipteronia sinensis]